MKPAIAHNRENIMETWITRIAAALCAAGSLGLLWFFGMFATLPWREGRMLALTATEIQVIGVSLAAGAAVGWGALHLFGLADANAHPRAYRLVRSLLLAASLAAIIAGILWSNAHVR